MTAERARRYGSAVTRFSTPRRLSVLVILLAVGVAPSCAPRPAEPASRRGTSTGVRHEFTHPALGSEFRVVIYCPDKPATARAERAVIRRLAELEEVFDDARPTSELSQVYANAGIGTVRVSPDLFGLLRDLRKVAVVSKGAFEVTAGAHAELWGRAVDAGALPEPAEAERAAGLVGHDKLRLDPINRTVHMTTPGVRLDLAGVVPGYACDRVLAALRSAGMPSALIDGGRQVAVGDPPPGRNAWLVKVNNAAPESALRVVRLARQGIASSGTAGDVVEIDGEAYSRLVDARTGVGATHLAPATAVARRAWQADAMARAAAVLGDDDTRAMLRVTPNVKVWFHRAAGAKHTADATARARPE